MNDQTKEVMNNGKIRSNGKIRAKTFKVLSCESNAPEVHKYPLIFELWSEINEFILWKAISIKIKGTYLKMRFQITFENGSTYAGRYDIQHQEAEQWDLGKHIIRYLKYHTNQRKNNIAEVNRFLDTFEIFTYF